LFAAVADHERRAVATVMGVNPSCYLCYAACVGLRQILMNLSWETLWNLPPSDLLALFVLSLIGAFLVLLVAGAVVTAVAVIGNERRQ
jgi:hypothetical protein